MMEENTKVKSMFTRLSLMAKDRPSIQIILHTVAIGVLEYFTEKVNLHGQMDLSMTETISTAKSREKGNSSMQIKDPFLETGLMENSKDKEPYFQAQEIF